MSSSAPEENEALVQRLSHVTQWTVHCLDSASKCGLPDPQTRQSENLAALRRIWTEAVAQRNGFRGRQPGKLRSVSDALHQGLELAEFVVLLIKQQFHQLFGPVRTRPSRLLVSPRSRGWCASGHNPTELASLLWRRQHWRRNYARVSSSEGQGRALC